MINSQNKVFTRAAAKAIKTKTDENSRLIVKDTKITKQKTTIQVTTNNPLKNTLQKQVPTRKRPALGDVNINATQPSQGNGKALKPGTHAKKPADKVTKPAPKEPKEAVKVNVDEKENATVAQERFKAGGQVKETRTSVFQQSTQIVNKKVVVSLPDVSPVTKPPGAQLSVKKPIPNIESIKKVTREIDMESEVHVAKKSKFTGWDDLDADDVSDPLMVSEYVVEIYEYLKEVEIETKPSPDYMSIQTELKWKMRTILIDWLVDVHSKFRLLPETLFLAVNLIDRFLSLRVVSCAKLQLVGIAAMFIASKYEEVSHPTIANFIFLADGGYNEEEVLKAERYILQVLNFGLQYPNPMNFLRRCSKAENYDMQTRTLGKYLMEITLMDHRFLEYVPSAIAGAALYLSRKMLNKGGWDVNLAHYSSYSEEELEPVAQLMLDYLSKPSAQESIFNKYSTKRYLKASVFVDDWMKKHKATESASSDENDSEY
ncbi:G2/mitotic-specific cyclin [Lobulomyces angularis]|nr:G2/mitotic-specific cyclin [Lobulomyces angularis]